MSLAACSQKPKPPYTAVQYDSILTHLVMHRDSVIRKMVKEESDKNPNFDVNNSASMDTGRYYRHLFDSIALERLKYYAGN